MEEITNQGETLEVSEEEQGLFSHVHGHNEAKKELTRLLDCFAHSSLLKSRGISFPHGVLLYGTPGNGKSMLLKAASKSMNCSVVTIKGAKTDFYDELVQKLSSLSKFDKSIVILDEIDLLIGRDRRTIRFLQEKMDEEHSPDVLLLAATNNLKDIPESLRRSGRFEKIIEIKAPANDEAIDFIERKLIAAGASLSSEFERKKHKLSFAGASYADLQSIADDVLIESGPEEIGFDAIKRSASNVLLKSESDNIPDHINVAIHEAGHAAVVAQFPQFFSLEYAFINGLHGETKSSEIDHGYWPFPKVIADICISLAGPTSEKFLNKEGSFGSEKDLQRARSAAYRLISYSGYRGIAHISSATRRSEDSPQKKRQAEKQVNCLLRHCEMRTKSIIKKNKQRILALAEALMANKKLDREEILELIKK